MENPLNISKYLEKTKDTILSANDANIAPLTCFIRLTLCLDINLYTHKNIINIIIKIPICVIISETIV